MAMMEPGLAHRLAGSNSLSTIPTALLRAELAVRQTDPERPECGTHGGRREYNTPLHFAALILILVLSTVACSFPIVARRFPRLPVPHRFLFLSRHFGTGVLIATAFVHLLPTAFVSLTDPCLPPFWNQGYPAMAGFIALVSVLTVVGIEMFFASRGAGHVHGGDYGMIDQEAVTTNAALSRPKTDRSQSSIEERPFRNFRQGSIGGVDPFKVFDDDTPLTSAVENHGDLASEPRSSSDVALGADSYDFANPERNPKREDSFPLEPRLNVDDAYSSPVGDNSSDRPRTLPSSTGNENLNRNKSASTQLEEQKLLLQCLLLEAGILFHSVFIGLALSVATGTSFVVLLVAISFHQFFEGLALGSRIAAITSFSKKSMKPWLMALAYGTTTPIGQAIGLGIHNLYDPASETGLLMVGVMNAISSGLLLFAGLVELLAEDFLSDESYVTLQGRKRIEACGAVVAGSFLMSLVGAWA